ncbi:MAG TPA: ATPase, T2SS/T4P/T4SS family [bacterium]|nr:ATPase, T2SS/T4P/T4SS family [bacterium]
MKQLGKLLVEEGMVDADQLNSALDYQKKNGGKLGAVFVQLGFLSEEALYYFLAVQLGLEYVAAPDVTPDIVKMIPSQAALKFGVVPYRRDEHSFTLITSDPTDSRFLTLHDELLLPATVEIRFCVTTETQLKALLERHYPATPEGEAPAGMGMPVDTSKDLAEQERLLNPEDFLNSDTEGEVESGGADDVYDENKVDDAPVIRLVNSIISSAVAKGASDIHLNPFEKNMVVRLRIDGNLYIQPASPPKYRRAMVARIKVMGKMDIMEKRKPQDGRIKIKVQGKTIDLRVATLPTIYGENVVMRILDQESLQLDLTKLGFEPDEMEVYMSAIRKPYGMVLHTGPTGSGKTTTLYSALGTINDPGKNLMTLEDPVEYNLPGVVQCQVNPDSGLNFSSGLRANMRQDPNVIMVGEIRDGETADIAVKAALTGHLVLSTLHTNNAPATVMRLVDMGIDPMYVGSSLLVVVAQRLVRRVCKDCKRPYEPDDDELLKLRITRADIKGHTCHKGLGCDRCGGSGYKGRVALYEIMRMTPKVEEAIYAKVDLNDLTEVCIQEGMQTLRMLAVKKWKMGVTSSDEVLAVTAAAD